MRREVSRVGTGYGGWDLANGALHNSSIVYSFGVGTDISFDLGLIDKYGVTVHAFDPTPRSIEWVRKQRLPDQFLLHEYGLGTSDGFMTFYPPDNPDHVSHTAIQKSVPERETIDVPVKKLATIMAELGHSEIAVLKMDIEGSEYAVIEEIASSEIRPRHLLVEFHHRFPSIGVEKTLHAIRSLRQLGYRLYAISDAGEEYSFEYAPE